MRNSPRAVRKSGGLSASSAGAEARKRTPAVRRRAALAGVNFKAVAFMFASMKAMRSIFHAVSGNKLPFQKYLLVVRSGYPKATRSIKTLSSRSWAAEAVSLAGEFGLLRSGLRPDLEEWDREGVRPVVNRRRLRC